jgi:hypothetical protein
MSTIRPLIVAAMLATAAQAQADVELRQEHVFDARPGQKVSIEVSFHTVEVEVAPGSTVTALVEISSTSSSSKTERMVEELRPVFDESGDTLVIRSVRRGGWGSSSSHLRGRVTVTMPPGLDLAVGSSSGSITVVGDLGDGVTRCSASSGSVTVRGAMRELAVETSSGSIRASVTRPLERFTADASSGSVRLEGGARNAFAATSSGGIDLDGLLGDAGMSASSGSIGARWDSIPAGGSVRASASSGSVTLTLPPGTTVAGTADTASGGIRSDFKGTFERGHATFAGGPGAVEVRVSTSSGGVKLLAGS